MDEVSQERVDDAWDEGFAHGYSRGNEEGLKIAFKDGYDFGAKTVSTKFAAEIERLRGQCDRMASLAIDNAKDTERAMRLQEALREIYEVYAGSEGIPQPMTAAEGYLLSLLMEVVRIAQEALKEKE